MSGKIAETSPSPLFPESSFKYNPIMHIRVLMVRFVQGLFSAAPPGEYRWTADDQTTEIYITDEAEVDGEVVQRMPTVSFIRGPIQFYSLGMDDMEKYDFATDKKTKGVLLPGTFTINVCAKVALESEAIAFVIADHLWLLRDLLMKQGFFEIGRGIQVGSPSAPGTIVSNDGGKELFCTPVSVPFQFARLSSFTPLGRQIIQSIEQCLHVQPGPPVSSDGAPTQSHEVPVSYQYQWPQAFAPEAINLEPPSCRLQPHPLNPAQMVKVRVVRGNSARSKLPYSRAAIPIPRPCMEQSAVPAPAFKQKG